MLQEALQLLRVRIYDNRHGLMDYYNHADSDGNGSLPVDVWVRGLELVTNLNEIPWEELAPYLATVEKDNTIQYARFLARYRINVSEEFVAAWTSRITKKICDKVLTSLLLSLLPFLSTQ